MPTMAPPNPNVQTGHNPNNVHNPNQQPSPNQTQLDTIRIGLASLDNNVDAFSREAAHSELAEDKMQGPLYKRFAKSVWQTMMRERVVTHKTHEKRQEILESGNLRHHQGASDKQWYVDVSRRYTSEFAEHLIHEEAGETFYKLSDAEQQNNPEALRIRGDINKFLEGYAKGDIDDPSVEPYLDRMFEKWRDKGVGEQFIGEGKFLAHNLVDGARQVKAAYEARQGLDAIQQAQHLKDILANVEINLGEAKVGSRTEIEATRSERLAKKLQNVEWLHASEGNLSKIGAVLSNELVLSAMLSVAFAVSQKGASAASIVAPGLAGGIISAFRERRALRDDRALMSRRKENGQEADSSNEAQAEIDATLHKSRPVGELLGELSALYDQNGDLTVRNRSDLDAALRLQAEIRARIQISDREDTNLINFADISPDQMEGRRFDLDLAMAKIETDLKKLFANPAAVGMLDIQQGETYGELFAAERFIMIGLLSGEMDEQDRLFNKLVRKRALQRSVITALTAIGGGVILRYGYDILSSLYNNVFGDKPDAAMTLASNKMDIGGGTTPESIGTIGNEVPHVDGTIGDSGETPDFTGTIGNPPSEVDGPIGDTGKTPEFTGSIGNPDTTPEFTGTIGNEVFKGGDIVILGDKTKVVLPEGFRAEVNGNDVKLTMPDGKTIESALEKNGELSQSMLDILKNNGLNIAHHEDAIEGEPKVTHEKVNAREFVENHKHGMVNITHQDWFRNGTDKVYSLNELELRNTQLGNGNMRISITGMTADGSFNGRSGVDWQEAAEDGQLKLYLSASPGTQAHAFEIPIDPDGTIDIDKDSPAGALFSNEGKFIGGYQEVAVKGDVNSKGATKIATLATVVGTQNPEINDVIVTPTTATAHTYTIIPPQETMAYTTAFTKPEDIFIPVVPLYARRNLGEAQPAAPAPNTGSNATNVGPNNGAGNNTGNQNNPGGPNAGNQQANPNTGNQQGNPNNGNPAPGNPNTNPGPGSPNGSPNNPNAAPGNNAGNNPNSATQKQGNPNANNGGGPNKTNPNSGPTTPKASGNPNQQKPQSRQAKGGGRTTPPNKGRPKNNQWSSHARQQTGPNSAQQNGNSSYQYAKSYSAEEVELLKKLTKDVRDMPDTFKFLPWDPNMTPTAHKIIVVILHGLIDASNRQPGESESAWRSRVIKAGREYARRGLGALNQTLPGVRPFMQEALDSFLAVTEPTPAGGPNTASNTNTTNP